MYNIYKKFKIELESTHLKCPAKKRKKNTN